MDASDLMASQSGIIDNFKLTRRNLPKGQEIKTPDNNRDCNLISLVIICL